MRWSPTESGRSQPDESAFEPQSSAQFLECVMRPRIAWTARGRSARLGAFTLCALSATAAGSSDLQRGHDLFHGTATLSARLAGHSSTLPQQAAKCTNCHLAGPARTTAPSGGGSTQAFGPLLTPARLLQNVARRGGPPSRYDEGSFCRVLTTGIDPAYVMVQRAMPRYEMSTADCRALWAYLSQLPQ